MKNIQNKKGKVNKIKLNKNLNNIKMRNDLIKITVGILVISVLITWEVCATEEGLVAYYSFNEGSGNVVHDLSGNGNNGTISGANWVDGISSKALEFDGVDDYVDISSIPNYAFTSITISAWVRVDGDTKHIQQFFESTTTGWEIFLETDGNIPYKIRFQITDDAGNGHEIAAGRYNISEWHYIVGTYDGHTQKLYVDGELKASSSWSGTFTLVDPQVIGIDNNKKIQPLKGIIDEVKIYNRALTESEIKANYNKILNRLNRPDLALQITPVTTANQNQLINISILINNTGNTTAPKLSAVKVTIKVTFNNNIIKEETRTVNMLNKSSETLYDFTFIPANAGTYNISVFVDPENKINESNETNNNAMISLSINCTDVDNDTVCDDVDNCPTTYNPDQNDTNGDGVGDPCDNKRPKENCGWEIIHNSVWYEDQPGHWLLNSTTAMWDANGDNNFLIKNVQLPNLSNLVLEYDYWVHEAGDPESGCSGKGIDWWGNHTHLIVYVNGNKVKTHWGEWEPGQLGKHQGPFTDSIDLSSYSGQSIEIKFQASGYNSEDPRPYGDYKCWCGCSIGVENIKIKADSNYIYLLPCYSRTDLSPQITSILTTNQNQLTHIPITIINSGNTTAPELSAVKVAIKVTFNNNIIKEETRTVNMLNKSSETLYDFTFTPANAGTYNISVFVDPENKINESNETNNNAMISLSINCTDVDNDTVCDDVDNCPTTYNPDQNDTNGDGVGDTCDNKTPKEIKPPKYTVESNPYDICVCEKALHAVDTSTPWGWWLAQPCLCPKKDRTFWYEDVCTAKKAWGYYWAFTWHNLCVNFPENATATGNPWPMNTTEILKLENETIEII